MATRSKTQRARASDETDYYTRLFRNEIVRKLPCSTRFVIDGMNTGQADELRQTLAWAENKRLIIWDETTKLWHPTSAAKQKAAS